MTAKGNISYNSSVLQMVRMVLMVAKKLEVLTVRMSESEKKDLSIRASKAGLTQSEYVRFMLFNGESLINGAKAYIYWRDGHIVGGDYLLHKGALWLQIPGSRSGRFQLSRVASFPQPAIDHLKQKGKGLSWLPWPQMAEVVQYIYETFPGLTPRGLWLFSDQVALGVNDGESLEKAIGDTLAIAQESWYEA